MSFPTKKQLEYAEQIANALGKEIPNKFNMQVVSKFIAENKKEFYNAKNQMESNQIYSKIKENISIVDFASEIGLTPIRRGKYFSLKEHDSVIIDTNKNCFWRNSVSANRNNSSIGKGGSVIDFAQEFTCLSLKDILKNFSNRIEGISFDVKKKNEQEENINGLILPEQSDNMRRVYAYLIKSRGISKSVVQDFVDRKMLYQDNKGNCVFVSYENQRPVFGCIRGTCSGKRFLGDLKGCDYEKGFYVSNHANKLIVTESVIDAMSIMTILYEQGLNYKEYDYMPLASATKHEALLLCLKNAPKEAVLLALDNDKGGIKNMNIIRERLDEMNISVFVSDHIPKENDWNKELTVAIEQMNVKEIKFFNATKEIDSPFFNTSCSYKNGTSLYVEQCIKKIQKE